jgi:predicted dehydrogenase
MSEKTISSLSPLRLGLLSTAGINGRILAASAATEECEVVAVASRQEARAQAYARQHGLANAHGSYDALIHDPDVDAVYISLPNGAHVEWSRRALEAGKHVLCEKPLAWRRDDAEALFGLADRVGCVLTEGFAYRHHPQTMLLSRLVFDGAIGQLVALRGVFAFDALRRFGGVGHRFEVEHGGGALLDLGCYPVHTFRTLAGEPSRVMGIGGLARSGIDLDFAGLLEWPDGVTGQFLCSFRTPANEGLEVLGDEGSIHVARPWRPWDGAPLALQRGDTVERFELDAADPYRLELECFARAVARIAPLLVDRADSVAQASVLEDLFSSASEPAMITARVSSGEASQTRSLRTSTSTAPR